MLLVGSSVNISSNAWGCIIKVAIVHDGAAGRDDLSNCSPLFSSDGLHSIVIGSCMKDSSPLGFGVYPRFYKLHILHHRCRCVPCRTGWASRLPSATIISSSQGARRHKLTSSNTTESPKRVKRKKKSCGWVTAAQPRIF